MKNSVTGVLLSAMFLSTYPKNVEFKYQKSLLMNFQKTPPVAEFSAKNIFCVSHVFTKEQKRQVGFQAPKGTI